MVEDLIEVFIKELQKYNMLGICVLGVGYSNNMFRILKLLKDFQLEKTNIFVYTYGLNMKIRYMILEIFIK